MAEDETRNRALAKLSDQTLAPARSLAERTLASLRDPSDSTLAVPRRLIVAADGSEMFPTINAAIAVAVDGDEIVVEPGRYVEHLTINRSIKISGHGPRDRIILAPITPEGPCIAITGGAPHLIGFTIDGIAVDVAPGISVGRRAPDLILVTGGAPVLVSLDLCGGWGARFSGTGTEGAIRFCAIHDGIVGVLANAGARPSIEDNEIWATEAAGIAIGHSGSNPTVRGNRIHDGLKAGIVIRSGASARIEENEIWGHVGEAIVIDSGSALVVRANRIHDGMTGIAVYSADTRIEDNEIWSNGAYGIVVGADALISANSIHGGRDGFFPAILVHRGSAPRIEDNEIWANAGQGIEVKGSGTSPMICGNLVRDGLGDGISVLDGSSPTIDGNTVTGNALRQIRVSDNASPVIGENVISA